MILCSCSDITASPGAGHSNIEGTECIAALMINRYHRFGTTFSYWCLGKYLIIVFNILLGL